MSVICRWDELASQIKLFVIWYWGDENDARCDSNKFNIRFISQLPISTRPLLPSIINAKLEKFLSYYEFDDGVNLYNSFMLTQKLFSLPLSVLEYERKDVRASQNLRILYRSFSTIRNKKKHISSDLYMGVIKAYISIFRIDISSSLM